MLCDHLLRANTLWNSEEYIFAIWSNAFGLSDTTACHVITCRGRHHQRPQCLQSHSLSFRLKALCGAWWALLTVVGIAQGKWWALLRGRCISGGAWWALLEVDGGHYHCLRFALSCDDFVPANLLPSQPVWPFGKVLYMKFTNNGYKIRYFRLFYNLEGQECAFVWHSIGATRFLVRQAYQVNPE